MITVQVFHKDSGRAAKSVGVAVSFDGLFRGITGKEFTDSGGNVNFDVDPGHGKIYVGGKTVYDGRIEGRAVVYI